MDSTTKKWIWNASDERAARDGCRFDEARGQHFVDFCEQYLRLWEGEFAGQPLRCTNWQFDCLMRIFGWVKPSDFYKRDIRRFRKASIWVPKKNKKSPTGAAVGLYLLTFDGEQGAQVWSCARDGKQAGIVHRHAVNMANASPHLSSILTLNKTKGHLIYEDTNSFYGILAGDNIHGQEGWNGSVIMDEVHVIDDRLALVLTDMGASRAEPLEFGISTVGESIEGYGRKQYEHGKFVEAGTIHDEAFFFKSYEAPQDATDDEIFSNPEIWKQANPAWGETIREEEFRSAMQRAKRSQNDWSAFKQRRLNIWQKAANPWLKGRDWDKCQHELDPSCFAGVGGGVGLDLARVQDLTAAVFVVPREHGGFVQFPYFWLPEATADEYARHVSYRDWEKQGFVTLTPEEVVSYDIIEERLAELIEFFGSQMILYDPMYAEEITQQLVEATGIERIEFKQTVENYSEPTATYERMVIDGSLWHPGNLCLTWQAGHVMVKKYDDKQKPVKDKNSEWKAIDGIQAGIMGLLGALLAPKRRKSVYSRRGVLAV